MRRTQTSRDRRFDEVELLRREVEAHFRMRGDDSRQRRTITHSGWDRSTLRRAMEDAASQL